MKGGTGNVDWADAFNEYTVKVTAKANGEEKTFTLKRKVDPCPLSTIEVPLSSDTIL
jgi:hypothetical protein